MDAAEGNFDTKLTELHDHYLALLRQGGNENTTIATAIELYESAG